MNVGWKSWIFIELVIFWIDIVFYDKLGRLFPTNILPKPSKFDYLFGFSREAASTFGILRLWACTKLPTLQLFTVALKKRQILLQSFSDLEYKFLCLIPLSVSQYCFSRTSSGSWSKEYALQYKNCSKYLNFMAILTHLNFILPYIEKLSNSQFSYMFSLVHSSLFTDSRVLCSSRKSSSTTPGCRTSAKRTSGSRTSPWYSARWCCRSPRRRRPGSSNTSSGATCVCRTTRAPATPSGSASPTSSRTTRLRRTSRTSTPRCGSCSCSRISSRRMRRTSEDISVLKVFCASKSFSFSLEGTPRSQQHGDWWGGTGLKTTTVSSE